MLTCNCIWYLPILTKEKSDDINLTIADPTNQIVHFVENIYLYLQNFILYFYNIMQNSTSEKKQNELTFAQASLVIIGVITIVFIIILQLFIGKWIWNNILVKLFPSTISPMDNLVDILGLIILFSIF